MRNGLANHKRRIQRNWNSGDSLDFIDYLIEGGDIPARDVPQLRQLCAERLEPWGTLLTRLGLISEGQLAACYATYLDLPRLEADSLPDKPPGIDGLSSHFLRHHSVLPLRLEGQQLHLAVSDPLDDFTPHALGFAAGKTPILYVATRAEIFSGLDRLYPENQPAADAEAYISATSEDDIDRLRDLASEAPVIRLVQRLITAAIDQRASDIHLEPMEDGLSIRFRIDGLLREVERFPAPFRSIVVSRVKIMAQLDIAERRLPQDGRIRLTLHGRDTDFRVATSPTLHGESVVLRVLDRRDITLDFAVLGFAEQDLRKIRHALMQPHGIVLVTGPTGSGKTTTLYAALTELNSEARKILTAEDPIEYTLPRVNQVHIRPQIGHDFAHALRAFLRQDPDVIMVGEIRDTETARIAIQAALTGHLLLSTLHTNSAAAAVTRLLDMGSEEYLLASTLTLVIGQRLVRKLCQHCRLSYEAPDEFLPRFRLEEYPGPSTLYRAAGCNRCRGTGYAGRVAIAEVLEVGDSIRDLIAVKANVHVLERAAIEAGMQTMNQDGALKALAGLTTVEEVLRVTQNL